MTTYRIYKGFETPCRIHGYLSPHFFQLIGCAVLGVLIGFSMFNSALATGAWEDFLVYLILFAVILTGLHHVFRRKALKRKFSKEGEITGYSTRHHLQ